MPELFAVRANYGQYADHFVKGNYVAIGWLDQNDLSSASSRDEIYRLYMQFSTDTNPLVIGQQVGQISRFLFEIKPGDYVITMPSNVDVIYWGIIEEDPYFYGGTQDGCPYPHRKKVKWHATPVRRAQFSVPFQNTIRSSLTVFWIKHKNVFFEVIGETFLVSKSEIKTLEDNYDLVLNRILELDPTEFEILIKHILTALGFEAEHTGKVGDGGVDATGVLDINNIAKIKLYVQAKRYQKEARINEAQVKTLRQSIPFGGQGAFITTCDFHPKALEAATDPGFARIGTINGRQLVDILVENWSELDEDFKQKLGLKPGLVLA
jgi:restriction system protein